jgi:GST-like protein
MSVGSGEPSLLPQDPATQAQAIRALVYIAANCYVAIGVIDYPQRWCDSADDANDADDAICERVRSAAKRRLYQQWDLFADTFAACCLDQDKIRAPGVLASVVSRWSGTRAHLQSSRPAFLALLERIDRHPQVASVFARHWNGAA